MAHIVSAAWKCALSTYDIDAAVRLPTSPFCNFEHDYIVSPSVGGRTKAVVSTIVTPAADMENEFLPALVIAVRGSASKVDHMVNANSRARTAFEYDGRSIDAHSGFMNSAEALEDVFAERIRLYVQRRRSNAHIIFTGHSAGGAVATLLFLRRLLGSGSAPDARLSCITFGAPPVVSQALNFEELAPRRPLGLCLNIINEFDVVSRADRPYILSLVNMMRSLYGQPAIPDDVDITRDADDSPRSGAANAQQTSGSENIWPLPPPMYHHVGSRVLLLTRLDDDGRVCLKACEVPKDVFQQLLFCRVEVHRRACYSDRMQRLEKRELSA
ncbi:49df7fc9-f316-4213-be5e-f303876c423e [Thermothielavioides terrestris]|uniref:49df7fc9-f316-4213-be5e-f303876c423e n=1 Tax=Thermothielavioides terrestris TaxID=2587410 RepID=A0A3S4BI16_9PEZI|nr:49df7fc9-f316-4213-be5e-f303876c423e [Thermothielavioides terrestris]